MYYVSNKQNKAIMDMLIQTKDFRMKYIIKDKEDHIKKDKL